MAHIEKILSVVKRGGYYVTTALVDQDEYTGWSVAADEYKVGDNVQIFYDDRYDKAKMRKAKND